MSEERSFKGQRYALVTAGGTCVAIDEMRMIANRSEGDFGVAIANALAARGVPVVLLISRLGYYKFRGGLINSNVMVVPYLMFEEYVDAITQIVTDHGQPAYAFSAAAVSDFGVEHMVEGKISSSDGLPKIPFVELPKVLKTWRKLFGSACKIVGFKFLSRKNSTNVDLFTAAWDQNVSAHLDLTVGNFKEEIGDGKHPVYLVNPEGWVSHVPGDRTYVAQQIVQYVLSDGYAFIFNSPETWTKVIRSSSMCLRSRHTNRVLMLLRTGSTVFGNMWSNLGGRQDEEDLAAVNEGGLDPADRQLKADWITATREVYEESGKQIDLRGHLRPAAPPSVHYTQTIKKSTGERRVYRVACFQVDITGEPECVIPEGEGTEVRWVEAAEAFTLPIGPATRAALHETWPEFIS